MSIQQTNPRSILVTSALPYANGPLHLGHMVEYIQTDIWVRFQKLSGHQCFYVCADDAHGTAISLHAEKKAITPEQLIQNIHQERIRDFSAFNIAFDHYHSTHSKENQQLVQLIYNKLVDQGAITKREITQAFDPEKELFLADRYIKGTCPKCNADNQYGDNCEQCGATYSPSELINATSTLSGKPAITKKTEHYFFKLANYQNTLKAWVHSGAVPKKIANKLDEWLKKPLQDWDISRDAPYFGFKIPNTSDKYFYVWLDAPVGYMASFKYFIENTNTNITFDAFWNPSSKCEIHHFIGKDIINFHCLFWPAMLEGAGFRKPSQVHVHGYLTINSEKMSKSRGTFITAESYINHLPTDCLRYYYATKLSAEAEDLDFNANDFAQRINSDLVGKIVNIASRCAGFLNKKFDGVLGNPHPDVLMLIEHAQERSQEISKAYETGSFNKVSREITALADKTNSWIDKMQPWVVAKQPNSDMELQLICSSGIYLFRILMIYLKPILPNLCQQAEQFMNEPSLEWQDIKKINAGKTINPFKTLLTRITNEQVDRMLEENKQTAVTSQQETKDNTTSNLSNAPSGGPLPMIDFSTFSKVDLRVAKIEAAEAIEASDKLLKLSIDLGELGTRTVISGIKNAYSSQELVGKLVIVVANLEPRKMKFGTSEAMLLTAADDDKIWIIEPHAGAKPGTKVV